MSKMPFNVMRHNDWDRAPRDPITLFNFAVATLGFTTGGAILFAAVSTLAISAVTSWAISALTPRPRFGSLSSSGILVNTRDPAAAHQFVYGESRKGGTVTFLEATGETNQTLHQIVVLAGHEVDQIGDIYLNDEVVTIDAGNVVRSGPFSGSVYIEKFKGDQVAPPASLIELSELTGDDALTSNFVGNGIAYLYMRFEFDANVFANGIPLVTAVVRGKRVFDPRTSTTVWSDNAALCIRDYLTSAYGLSDSNIDETAFSAAANICDETVATAGAGNVKRYTINGVVTADTAHGEVLNQMVTACAGTLFWGTGKWKLTVADYVAPTKTLTLDDLRSGISLQTRTNLRDQFNTVQGTFINAAERWITQDYPPIVGSAFVAEDGNIEQPLDLALPFTTNAAIAQRLAKLTLFRGREQMTFSAEFGMNAFDVEVGEIIDLDMDRYGFDGKEFEVIGWQLKANQDAGDLRVMLTLRETSEAAFDWNAEESDIIGNNTNLPDPFGGLAINNLTASGGGRTQGDGTFINSAILNWDNVSNAFLDHYEVEWKPLSDSVYSATVTEQSDIELSPVIDGVEYIFRVRAVTVAGVKGPYSTVQFTGGGDVTAPGLPTDITATGHFEYISIEWTNPADADLNFVEIWEADTDNSASATRVGISGGNTFQRTNLGISVTKYYFLKAVDYSGNASAFTVGVSATTTFIDDEAFANGIYSLFTEQGLYAIEDVTSLPPSGDFVGQKVFNRTDGKLYDWTGTAWEASVSDASVGPGSITATEIADGAISTPKLAANAVVADKIAGNTITGNKIVANTITGGLLATSGIITNSAQINDAVIVNAKIQNAAVDTLKIAGNAVTIPAFAFADFNGTSMSGLTDVGILSSTINKVAAPTFITISGSVDGIGGADSFYNVRLLKNGSLIRQFDTSAGSRKAFSLVHDDTAGDTGSTTYLVTIRIINGVAGRLYEVGMFLSQFRR
jgi:hypothetical protein